MNISTLRWDAELYQEHSSIQFNLGLMAIDRLKPSGPERILDIGCGTALVSLELAKRIPAGSVTGIEASPEMYARALRTIDASGSGNVSVMLMNALDIAYVAEYDAVFSNSAIHWIRELETMYGLIYRALKPGGRIMIQTGLREMNPLVQSVIATLSDDRYGKYIAGVRIPWRFLDADETRAVLGAAGFTGVEIEPYRDQQRFDTPERLSGYFESAALVPFLAHIPDEEKPDFKRFFLDAYLCNNGGSLDVRTTRVFVSAVKP